LVPGVSRSGATIAGGLLLGTDKRSAAEFTFFLALPTMGGAVAWDLYKTWDQLDFTDVGLIAVGFATAFLTALLVVRFLLDFVSRHGFAPFAWWRIGVGVAGLALIAAGVGG
jgi:undecaprenyl-diphosphatase